MKTEEQMERLKGYIARLEQHPECHRQELDRLYALLAIYQQATGTALVADLPSRAALPRAA